MISGGFFRLGVGVVLACVIAASAIAAEPKAGKKSAGDDLFRDGAVAQIRVEISQEGMATLRKYQWKWGAGAANADRETVAATVKEGTTVYTNVAVHLKGAAGSFRPVDQNPGLTLNFNKWAKGQHFHGLDKISLNNSVQDPSLISDKFARELYARVGVPSPRAGHARVELNGRDLGLYVLTEGWNKQFLKRHFKNTKGNLYDCTFAHEVTGSMAVNSGDHPDDRSDLVALSNAVRKANSSKSLDALRPILDLDRFVNFIALDALMWNWDGYTIGHNNYRVFHDEETRKMVFMPHGLDQMFWRPDAPILPGGKGTVGRAYLGTAEGRQRYMEAVRKIMSTFFDSDTLVGRVREIADSLEPALRERPQFERERQEQAMARLIMFIKLRVASLRMQLTGSSNLVQLKVGESMPLTNWSNYAEAQQIHLTAGGIDSAASCRSTIWLEAGFYRLEGRVKTKGVAIPASDEPIGAGWWVMSERKPSEGTSWDWFPYRESSNARRGDLTSPNGENDRLTGESDWQKLQYDFELHQPMADLQALCELRADKGEAWFDLASIRLTRRPAPKNPPKQ